MVLTDGMSNGATKIVSRPIAFVGTGEKGYQTWKIKVSGKAGHSSIPPTGQGTSVPARLARILAALEKQQTATVLAAPTLDMVTALGPHTRWAPVRLLLSSAHNAVLRPLIGQILGAAGGELAAMVRTTVAVVGFKAGGEAHNLTPGDGEITINFRTLAGDDEATVRHYLSTIIHPEFPHVTLERLERMVPASPVSPASGPAFDLVQRAILETLPGSPVVAPYLVTGMTDSRWYQRIAPGRVYRFAPLQVERAELGTVHGVGERVRTAVYVEGVGFMMRFMKLAAGDAEVQ
jgi:carboxypeptidase PM20D1